MAEEELPGYEVLEHAATRDGTRMWRGRERATGDPVEIHRVPPGAVGQRALLPRGEHVQGVRAVRGDVLVADAAPGGTLARLLALRGALAPDEVVTIGAPLAVTLAALHREGLTHGRVVPQAVAFTRNGKPLLADPVLLAPLPAPALAPDEPAAAGDVYALAAVCWTALTGRPPVPGADAAALRAVVPAVPDALAAALADGLALDPLARPDAAGLAAALACACPPAPVRLGAVAAGPGTAAAPIPTRRAPVARPQGPASGCTPAPARRLAISAGLALLTVAVVVGLAWARAQRPEAAVSAAPAPVPAAPAAPATDWARVLAALDARRAAAFETASPRLLTEVYAPGSSVLAADLARVRALAAADLTARGVRLDVASVTPVSGDAERAVLRVVDRLASHEIVRANGAVQERRPGRGARSWRITVVRAGPERAWRIRDVSPDA